MIKIDITKKDKLAKLFKALREKKKMTGRQLAILADCTERTITNLETGNYKGIFKTETLKPIAKALDHELEITLKRKVRHVRK